MRWNYQHPVDFYLPHCGQLPERKCGELDLGCTECEVAECSESKTAFMVRPKEGFCWSVSDGEHSRQGTGFAFVLDCTGSQLTRSQWLEHFQQHIACGQARARGELELPAQEDPDVERALSSVLCRVDGALEQALDACSVCLDEQATQGEAAEERPVVRTACGHCFHEACARRWLRAHRRCPMCRKKLLRRKGGKLVAARPCGPALQRSEDGQELVLDPLHDEASVPISEGRVLDPLHDEASVPIVGWL
jgi:hypothetical protein